MIKINLLSQKRAKRGAGVAAVRREPAGKDVWVGVGVLAGIAAIVFFAIDQPRRSLTGGCHRTEVVTGAGGEEAEQKNAGQTGRAGSRLIRLH